MTGVGLEPGPNRVGYKNGGNGMEDARCHAPDITETIDIPDPRTERLPIPNGFNGTVRVNTRIITHLVLVAEGYTLPFHVSFIYFRTTVYILLFKPLYSLPRSPV